MSFWRYDLWNWYWPCTINVLEYLIFVYIYQHLLKSFEVTYTWFRFFSKMNTELLLIYDNAVKTLLIFVQISRWTINSQNIFKFFYFSVIIYVSSYYWQKLFVTGKIVLISKPSLFFHVFTGFNLCLADVLPFIFFYIRSWPINIFGQSCFLGQKAHTC